MKPRFYQRKTHMKNTKNAGAAKKQNKTNQYTVPIILAVCLAVILTVTIVILCNPRTETAEFTPPPFEPSAVRGTPEVPEALGYSSPYKEGMGYRFSVCGNVTVNGTEATVYLTNPEENNGNDANGVNGVNTVWIKLRVTDEKGNVLGETGLIKPGEYVKNVTLTKALPEGTKIRLKIMGYEPGTYKSAGSATLNTVIGNAE